MTHSDLLTLVNSHLACGARTSVWKPRLHTPCSALIGGHAWRAPLWLEDAAVSHASAGSPGSACLDWLVLGSLSELEYLRNEGLWRWLNQQDTSQLPLFRKKLYCRYHHISYIIYISWFIYCFPHFICHRDIRLS